MEFYGVFKEIEALNIPGLIKSDLYEGYFSEFYEYMSKQKDKDEIDIYLGNAYKAGGNVLELACGNGRLTMELAKKGVQVIGVDCSQDMLNILEAKVKKSSTRIRKNIKFYKQDIFNLDIKEDFNMVMIPATSICLLLDNTDKLLEVMNNLYDSLPEKGRFVFDYIYEFDEENSQPKMKIITNSDGMRKDFILIQEFRDFYKNRAVMNFYAEKIVNGETQRYLGCTSKTIVADEVINDLIAKTKYKVVEKIDKNDDSVGKIRFVVLEK